ncbi:MAG: DUF3524 domain-containing protein, partial [Pseudomonadota bacterium]|nr:DUF3524 domain-containing protein [Pseudomonadota bacterium]
QIESQFSHRLVQFGYAESREAYLNWLQQSDVVLSTSHPEFQGLSVLEAVACGAVPVLPNEQSYPFLFDREYLYDKEEEAVERLVHLAQTKSELVAPPADRFRWEHCHSHYRALLESMAERG